MKTAYLLAGLAVLTIVYSFSNNQNGNQFDQQNTGAIGDVKYSFLNPEQFKIVNGDGWVLLDGKTLDVNSALYKLIQSTGQGNTIPSGKLPNADGVFIRGFDSNQNDNYGDSQKDRIVGGFQVDILKKHKHPFMIHGNRATGAGCYYTLHACAGGHENNFVTTENGDGGDETRPKNICLYTYIKIN